MAGVAIIGDATSVAGFRPLGLATYAVEGPDEATAAWGEALRTAPAIIFVTEPVYEMLAELVAETADRPVPAVTIIPGVGSAGGVGTVKLERAIVRALGTKMPVREEDV
ncbi:MAG: V-type ATP synthase subunit F [Coriobacteriia bacterium]|nr:V-type ATP synthase subunit F [Coriobacteriia bacterium]